MPRYATFCLRTVAASAPHLHLFLVYENATMILPEVQADNIHYVSIKEGEVAGRLLTVLKGGLGSALVNERDEANVKKLLSLNPRKVGVYKPLFGAAFHDIIGDFSHWAWGDIDTLIGDVAGLVSAKDLREFDIISFNTGSGLLYLQGQLTILANRPEVNDAWKVQLAIVFIIFIIVFMSIRFVNVKNEPSAVSLTSAKPAFAWEETKFSMWALYSSSLRAKLMPLQFSGKNAKNWKDADGRVLIWEDGRLLLHSNSVPTTSPLPERVEAPLLYQDTWTSAPQRPGPYVLERLGSEKTCVWYGSRREAKGYDRRTEEYVVFHYNYEHEENIPNALAKKNSDEVHALLSVQRMAWNWRHTSAAKASFAGGQQSYESQFAYGDGSFPSVFSQENGMFWVDRTGFIPLLEALKAKAVVSLRNRRMGKTLWIDTLAHYYDVAHKGRFKELFGHLEIGKAPTQLANTFHTCVWYGSRREAKGYDRRTEEYVVFHYNYEHEENIPNALAKKNSDEVHALLSVQRMAWKYYPFDFHAAPPCDTPGGGNCPTIA
ncbi:uncharacterized protein ACA1_378630 [Acanthamoeba castellanii str. Neff]|uniref:AAA-ATPase-like domain-containing protein n=1 Tax=Acanthamoeba castellanii (strain ATCC 30010 / Neff) TaxID=1257118 RepID=L8GSY2_ACACF|nr:uncharacterized protein ACA1_378630 [Acanthamoeba castellanii str. Neff]ELR15713.1 hypothetical protein ACA1_378630 [Acanthamoeba castellanii str. Neff]